MVTDRTKGVDLFKEVFREYTISVVNKIKKEREKRIAKYKKSGRKIENEIKFDLIFETEKKNKWYIESSVKGNPLKPDCKSKYYMIVNGDKVKYILIRGLKTYKNDGYVVSFLPHAIKKIREKCEDFFGSSDSRIIFDFFLPGEIPCAYLEDWQGIEKQEEKIEKSVKEVDDHIPTIDEIWAEYLGKKPTKEKKFWQPDFKEKLEWIVIRCKRGYLFGAVVDKVEAMIYSFAPLNDLTGNVANAENDIFGPCYVKFNAKFFNEEEIRNADLQRASYLSTHRDITVVRLYE